MRSRRLASAGLAPLGRAHVAQDGILRCPLRGHSTSTRPKARRLPAVRRCRFENGAIVRADAEKNQAHLDGLLATDEGSRRVGEFGIGTNGAIKVFTKNMLFDEKIGGTIHLAIGAGFPETGAVNESAIHWDFLCDMTEGGQITVDEQAFYDSGRFLI